MAETHLTESIRELLKGLDGFITSKTVIGEPVTVNDTVIIPFMEVQIGVGAGAFSNKVSGTGGALGAKLVPSAILVIRDNSSRLISVKDQDTVLKVLDMVPEVIDRLKTVIFGEDPLVDEKVKEIAEAEPVDTVPEKAE